MNFWLFCIEHLYLSKIMKNKASSGFVKLRLHYGYSFWLQVYEHVRLPLSPSA